MNIHVGDWWVQPIFEWVCLGVFLYFCFYIVYLFDRSEWK